MMGECNLTIDDLAPVISSLAYLKRFPGRPFEDRPLFVRDLCEDREDAAIVASDHRAGEDAGDGRGRRASRPPPSWPRCAARVPAVPGFSCSLNRAPATTCRALCRRHVLTTFSLLPVAGKLFQHHLHFRRIEQHPAGELAGAPVLLAQAFELDAESERLLQVVSETAACRGWPEAGRAPRPAPRAPDRRAPACRRWRSRRSGSYRRRSGRSCSGKGGISRRRQANWWRTRMPRAARRRLPAARS